MVISLILSFLLIGALSFGGGFAVIPVMEIELVKRFALLTSEQLYSFVTLAQVAPGPVGVNTSTLAGYAVGGLGFAIMATLVLLVPPTIITLLLVSLWERWRQYQSAQNFISGLKPVVVALVATAGISMASRSTHDLTTSIVLIIATMAAARSRQHPLIFIGGALVVSLGYALLHAHGLWA